MSDKPSTRALRSSTRSGANDTITSPSPAASSTPAVSSRSMPATGPRSLRSSTRIASLAASETQRDGQQPATPTTDTGSSKKDRASSVKKGSQASASASKSKKDTAPAGKKKKEVEEEDGHAPAGKKDAAPTTNRKKTKGEDEEDEEDHTPTGKKDGDPASKMKKDDGSKPVTPVAGSLRSSSRIAELTAAATAGAASQAAETGAPNAGSGTSSSTPATSSIGSARKEKTKTAAALDVTKNTATTSTKPLRSSSRIAELTQHGRSVETADEVDPSTPSAGVGASALAPGTARQTRSKATTTPPSSTPVAAGEADAHAAVVISGKKGEKRKSTAAAEGPANAASKKSHKEDGDSAPTTSGTAAKTTRSKTTTTTAVPESGPKTKIVLRMKENPKDDGPTTTAASARVVEPAAASSSLLRQPPPPPSSPATPNRRRRAPHVPSAWPTPLFRHNDLHKWLVISEAPDFAAVTRMYGEVAGWPVLPRREEFLDAFKGAELRGAVRSLRAMVGCAGGVLERLARKVQELGEGEDGDVVMGEAGEAQGVVEEAGAGEGGREMEGGSDADDEESDEDADDNGRALLGTIRGPSSVTYKFRNVTQRTAALKAFRAALSVPGTTDEQAHAAAQKECGMVLAREADGVKVRNGSTGQVETIARGPDSPNASVGKAASSSADGAAQEAGQHPKDVAVVSTLHDISSGSFNARSAPAPAVTSVPDDQTHDVDMTDPFIDRSDLGDGTNRTAYLGQAALSPFPTMAELEKQFAQRPLWRMTVAQMRNEIMRLCALRERLVAEGDRMREKVKVLEERRREEADGSGLDDRSVNADVDDGGGRDDGPDAQLRREMASREISDVDAELLALADGVVAEGEGAQAGVENDGMELD